MDKKESFIFLSIIMAAVLFVFLILQIPDNVPPKQQINHNSYGERNATHK